MEQVRRSDLPPRDRDEEPAPAAPVVSRPAQVQPIDDLLDEIDAVLEDSAEAFVRGFVQKGGQ
jgi:ubiquitin-like protein Pup